MNANELLQNVLDSGVLHGNSTLAREIRAFLNNAHSKQVIVAGSVSQAINLAKAKGVSKSFVYVRDVTGLFGLKRGQTVWLYGTYYNLPQWSQMEEYLRLNDNKTLRVVQ